MKFKSALLLLGLFQAVLAHHGSDESSESNQDICRLPADIGQCFQNWPRFYYDSRTGRCQKLKFGGCGGNANNFKTRRQCEKRCADQVAVHPIHNICHEGTAMSGTCFGNFPRYTFNRKTGRCERFIYGGCGGTNNNFESQLECQHACMDVCNKPAYRGKCRAYLPRFFYNAQTKRCEKFIYGGCGSNGNNFFTKSTCEDRCLADVVPTPAQDICLLPKVGGPCKAAISRYYFDTKCGKCKAFVYGGCHGNENNFKTKDECREQCMGEEDDNE